MKLGDYTFVWEPDNFDEPLPIKYHSSVLTYSSVAFYSWGCDIVGKKVALNWAWMKEIDYLNLQALLEDDESKTWDLEEPMRLYHDTVVNGPWTVGHSITGAGGAVGVVSAVNIVDSYVTFSAVNEHDFVHGEYIQCDDLPPTKTSTVTGVRIHPNYTVQILSLNGTYHEVLTTNFIYRSDIELLLLITAEL